LHNFLLVLSQLCILVALVVRGQEARTLFA
jgi:hypothetical protein